MDLIWYYWTRENKNEPRWSTVHTLKCFDLVMIYAGISHGEGVASSSISFC
jgi:hypothetical protein